MTSSLRRMILPAAVALLMALSLTGIPPAQAGSSTSLRFVADTDSAQPTEPFQKFDAHPPKIFDFNGDGRQEIIAQNDNQWVYVFDSGDGTLLAELETRVPSDWGARHINGPEVAIMDDGQQPRLIVANSAAIITSFRYDPGNSDADHFGFVKEWDRRLNDCFSGAGMDAKPVLADLDKDGTLEILGTTEEKGVFALRADGSLYWKNCVSGGNGEPGVADLNGDGWPDVVHVSDGGLVAAFNGRTGGWMWGLELKDHFDLRSGSIPVGPGIGQLDGLGGPDIVVGARDSHDTDDYSNNSALLAAVSSGGSILWGVQDPHGNPLSYTHPAVVDADGDGTNEIYWGDWNTIGHKGGIPPEDSWQSTGDANYYRYDNHGNRVWKQSLGTYWSNKDIAMADVDGDGTQEMLANGPGTGGDGIWYLNGQHGGKEHFVGTHPWKVSRGPIVGDMDDDGGMQWLVPVEAADNSVSGGAIMVFDTNKPYSAAWPHVPYPDDPLPDGGGGGGDDGDGGDGTGDFDASFSGVNGNEWWIQAQVSASGGTLSKVDVSLDGGSWRPLQDEGWGWAKSYHAPQSTIVQLRATSSGGDTDQSGCYRWTDATPVECASEPPPSGDFDASFSGVGGNSWWIQSQVSASGGALSKVDVSLDGGSWRPLQDEGWGWAASYHAAEGTIVQLRATASSGATDHSACYRWTDAAKTECGGGGGDGGDAAFDPTFTPKSVGNDWWVEVDTDADRTIEGVDAQVGGGGWTALDATDWGTWAKSIHAPDGTEVRFRATDGSDTVQSSTYTWS